MIDLNQTQQHCFIHAHHRSPPADFPLFHLFGNTSIALAGLLIGATLIDNPEFQKTQWATLAKGIIGGAPCPMELMRRIVEDIGVSDITVGGLRHHRNLLLDYHDLS